MNVNNFIKYTFLINLFLFYSCKTPVTDNKEEENTYQIISYILNNFREMPELFPSFPPPPNGKEYTYTIQDSLQTYKYTYEEKIRKKTIAFLPKTFILEKENMIRRLKVVNECTNDKDLINSFLKSEKSIEIDIKKIANLANDSLIYYTEKHEKMLGKGFLDIDIFHSSSY